MPRRRKKCKQGHEISGDNAIRNGGGHSCRICYDAGRSKHFTENSWVDWVVVVNLMHGRSAGRKPTLMEILVAAQEVGVGLGQQEPIYDRLGLTRAQWDWARDWGRRHRVTVPTLDEVFYATYQG